MQGEIPEYVDQKNAAAPNVTEASAETTGTTPSAVTAETHKLTHPQNTRPAGIPREREMPVQQPQPAPDQGGGAAFVPFGKRPLEFVTCYKVKLVLVL